jgi:hydroxylamine reductase
MNDMFCFQCQETMKYTGCTQRGTCGKTATVVNLQDLVIYCLRASHLGGPGEGIWE